GGAVGVALEPDGEQLEVGPGVGVQGRQAVDVGPEDLGRGRRDDLEVGASHWRAIPLGRGSWRPLSREAACAGRQVPYWRRRSECPPRRHRSRSMTPDSRYRMPATPKLN